MLNKIDLLKEPPAAREALSLFPGAVAISALKRSGLSDLKAAIQRSLYESYIPIAVDLPYREGALIALFHEHGKVDRIKHKRRGVVMEGRMPGRMVARFHSFAVDESRMPEPGI